MVTSTSTPGSMEMEVICLTISEGECKSIKRLWIFISNLSKVSEPLPQGDLRVVMRRTLVGRRTGPFTLSCLSLARWTRSEATANYILACLYEVRKKKSYPFPNSWHCEKTRWYGCGGSYYAYICLESFDHLILPLSLLGLFLFFKARLFSSVLSLHYWWLLLRIIQLYL